MMRLLSRCIAIVTLLGLLSAPPVFGQSGVQYLDPRTATMQFAGGDAASNGDTQCFLNVTPSPFTSFTNGQPFRISVSYSPVLSGTRREIFRVDWSSDRAGFGERSARVKSSTGNLVGVSVETMAVPSALAINGTATASVEVIGSGGRICTASATFDVEPPPPGPVGLQDVDPRTETTRPLGGSSTSSGGTQCVLNVGTLSGGPFTNGQPFRISVSYDPPLVGARREVFRVDWSTNLSGFGERSVRVKSDSVSPATLTSLETMAVPGATAVKGTATATVEVIGAGGRVCTASTTFEVE